MPCKDITELMRVSVDAADRLIEYRFVKKTCGQGVGAANLLQDALAGRSVDDLVAIAPETFLEAHPAAEPIEEFLALKHLIAVQSALEVLAGRASGGPDDLCAAAEIAIDPAGIVTIDARIRVDLVADKIEACGNCRSCGKDRKPAAVKPVFA